MEGLTLNRSRHDVLIPTMLPEKELTTGLQEPIQTPGLLARVRNRTLPAHRGVTKRHPILPSKARRGGDSPSPAC